MGKPYFQIKDLIRQHGIAVFSSNYTLYGDMSARVMDTLREFTSDVEVYSIDEAFFCDLSGFMHLDLDAYGRTLRDKVKQWTGIPVSIGIARTKTLAKVANKVSDKDYVALIRRRNSPGIDHHCPRLLEMRRVAGRHMQPVPQGGSRDQPVRCGDGKPFLLPGGGQLAPPLRRFLIDRQDTLLELAG